MFPRGSIPIATGFFVIPCLAQVWMTRVSPSFGSTGCATTGATQHIDEAPKVAAMMAHRERPATGTAIFGSCMVAEGTRPHTLGVLSISPAQANTAVTI